MKFFSIIVATDLARGIGKDNQLPWNFPEDMQHFKEITLASGRACHRPNAVIMGRRTWESLPSRFRPLPGRQNAVLSTDPQYIVPSGVLLFNSLASSVDFFCVRKPDDFGEVFVIGGARVYGAAIQHESCHRIYQTIVQDSFDCDTFFPEIPLFFRERECHELIDKGGTRLVFRILERNPLSS